jgi:hypothetical protein
VSSQAHHLTEDEVARILDLVHEADAVVVGGQSMAIWARHEMDLHITVAFA